jgi:transposase
MRTSPYDKDLREKVIKYLESGKSQSSATVLFKLNPSTISRWWLRYKKEGHYEARVRIGKKPRVNEKELKKYVDLNPNFKTSDMGKYFGMSGAGALYWLKKLGYSYKKKPLPTWKLKKKGDQNI